MGKFQNTNAPYAMNPETGFKLSMPALLDIALQAIEHVPENMVGVTEFSLIKDGDAVHVFQRTVNFPEVISGKSCKAALHSPKIKLKGCLNHES